MPYFIIKIQLVEVENLEDYFMLYEQTQKFRDFQEKYKCTENKENDSKKSKFYFTQFKDLPTELEIYPFLIKQKESTVLYSYLEEIKPKTIIIFEPSLLSVRLSEMFAVHIDSKLWPIQIYLVYFKDSIEHIAYLKDIAREKVSFEHLIRAKSVIFYYLSQTRPCLN